MRAHPPAHPRAHGRTHIGDNIINERKMEDNNKSIHEKAIRLIEGGIVEVSGLCVRMGRAPLGELACYDCEMDCLCHKGDSICDLCEECDNITRDNCYLILVS